MHPHAIRYQRNRRFIITGLSRFKDCAAGFYDLFMTLSENFGVVQKQGVLGSNWRVFIHRRLVRHQL